MAALPPEGLADPELAAWISSIRASPNLSNAALGVATLREASRSRALARPKGPEVRRASEFIVPGSPPVLVRLYVPFAPLRALFVFCHGGGWTIGSLESHDRICRRLAITAEVAVVAVDFRLAPESPWPAAIDDVLTVLRWAFRQSLELVGTDVVAVAGDSSGGNVATLACLRLRDAGERQPVLQVLAFPNTDLTFSSESFVEKESGWGLEAADARWFASQWVADPSLLGDPRVSPLFESDLSGLAPAIVVTAEHDPLRDQGDAYAARLAEAGVPVIHRCEPGLVHGFLTLDTVSPAAGDAGDRLFGDVRRGLS